MRDAVHIELLGHATVIVRAGDCTILFDPHLYDAFGNGHFGYYPPRTIDPALLPPISAIVISHSHRDHFDPASLALLPRETPVFCPLDRRIAVALSCLGFHDVMHVSDWTQLSPTADLSLVWTPSTYRVPEHGIAFRYRDLLVWNVVDSVIGSVAVVRETLRLLGGARFDLVMMPCMPMEETEATDGEVPGDGGSVLEDAILLAREMGSRYLLPFADGHFSKGRSEWSNSYRFPVEGDYVASLLSQHLPGSLVVAAGPGDRVVLDTNGLEVHGQALAYVRRTEPSPQRKFYPADFIEPLCSAPLREARDRDLQRERHALADGIGAQAIRMHTRKHLGGCALQPCRYEVLFVDDGFHAMGAFRFALDGEAIATQNDDAAPCDIDIAIACTDFRRVLAGDLAYASAYLGGRIREYRRGALFSGDVVVAKQPWLIPRRGEKVVLSGTLVLNCLLRHSCDPVATHLTKELAAIAAKAGPPRPYACQRVSVDTEPATLAKGGDGMDAVWVALEAALSEGRSLASASRAVTIAGKPGWCGVLGEGGWPREAKDFSQGFLVLHNLLDRQPHMGDGVGFPDTSYRSLLRNIRESGIEAFEILYAVPDDVVVPRWRLPSLFPVAPELLRRDLGVGWKGIVAGELQAGGVEREWWRGLPRLEGASRHVEQTTLPESPLPLVTSIFEARRCPQLGRYPRLKMTMEGSFRYAFTLGAAGIGMSDRRERHRSARLGCLQQINAHLAGGAAPSA